MTRRDPAEYDGRKLCERCGRDEHGDYWPLCADRKPDGTWYTHDESCHRYGEHAWLCPACERALEPTPDERPPL